MTKSTRQAVERRRSGIERTASLTTGALVAAGAGAVAIAVGLAVSTPATAGSNPAANSTGTTGTTPEQQPAATSTDSDGTATQQQPAATNGGLAPAGNSAPQTQSSGS